MTTGKRAGRESAHIGVTVHRRVEGTRRVRQRQPIAMKFAGVAVKIIATPSCVPGTGTGCQSGLAGSGFGFGLRCAFQQEPPIAPDNKDGAVVHPPGMCRDGVSGEEGAGVGKEAPPDEKLETRHRPPINK